MVRGRREKVPPVAAPGRRCIELSRPIRRQQTNGCRRHPFASRRARFDRVSTESRLKSRLGSQISSHLVAFNWTSNGFNSQLRLDLGLQLRLDFCASAFVQRSASRRTLVFLRPPSSEEDVAADAGDCAASRASPARKGRARPMVSSRATQLRLPPTCQAISETVTHTGCGALGSEQSVCRKNGSGFLCALTKGSGAVIGSQIEPDAMCSNKALLNAALQWTPVVANLFLQIG